MNTISESSVPISLTELSIGLGVSLLLGLFLVGIYRFTHRGFHYEKSFLTTLMMMPSIVCVVMMLIGSNLALSLGMVGALSIIRFRTVIKDSRDMVFLFLAIAIGLGGGTFNYIVTITATTALMLTILVLYYLEFGKNIHEDHVLVIKGTGAHPPDGIGELISNHVEFYDLRSLDIEGGNWEVVYEIRYAKDEQKSSLALIKVLEGKFDIENISILAPQLSLPV